jgi:hypothetical protein
MHLEHIFERLALLLRSSGFSRITASIGARKLSHRTAVFSASSGSPLALSFRPSLDIEKPWMPHGLPRARPPPAKESDLPGDDQPLFFEVPLRAAMAMNVGPLFRVPSC